MHHAMVDGGLRLAPGDLHGEVRTAERRRAAPAAEAPGGGAALDPRSGYEEGSELAREAAEAARMTLDFWKEIALHPLRSYSKAAATARSTVGLLEDLGKRPIPDPITEGASGIHRRIDHTSVSLNDLRRVHDALGVTINDLVLTAVSGAFGRYHALRGVSMESLRSMVPVSLRADHERGSLGNKVGMLNVTLPVGEVDPRRRLAIIRRRTGRAKGDRRGSMYPTFMRLVTALPGFAFRAFIQSTAGN
jgi:hypothetical protein